MEEGEIAHFGFQVDTEDGVGLAAWRWVHTPSLDDQPVILFVHQYTIMGGRAELMTGMLRYAMKDLGYDVIAFDMRGAGSSLGSPSYTGSREVEDVRAMIRYIRDEMGRDCVICASSAGCPIAGSTIDDFEELRGIFFIGYVFGFWASILFSSHYQPVLSSSKPKMFVMGDEDGFTSERTLRHKISQMEGSVNKIEIIEGIGHFELEGPDYDKQMMDLMHDFIQQYIIHQSNENQKQQEEESKN